MLGPIASARTIDDALDGAMEAAGIPDTALLRVCELPDNVDALSHMRRPGAGGTKRIGEDGYPIA